MTPSSLVVALTTVADEASALALARALVTERLAACVQRVPVASTYMWKGVVEESSEVLLVIKAPRQSIDALRARVLALHAYEVPEFVVLEACDVAERYLSWALTACAGNETA